MVTVMVWAPAGVPGFVAWLDGDEELQPEKVNRLAASKSVNNITRAKRRLSPRVRRGVKARKRRLAHATPCNGVESLRRSAVVGAVVVIVSVEVAAPLDGVTEEGAKVQPTPVGNVPQENFTVPL